MLLHTAGSRTISQGSTEQSPRDAYEMGGTCRKSFCVLFTNPGLHSMATGRLCCLNEWMTGVGDGGLLRPLPRDICTESAKAQTDKRDEVPGQTPSVSAAVTLVTDVRSFCGGGEMTPS